MNEDNINVISFFIGVTLFLTVFLVFAIFEERTEAESYKLCLEKAASVKDCEEVKP